jgi:hypothetical protein
MTDANDVRAGTYWTAHLTPVDVFGDDVIDCTVKVVIMLGDYCLVIWIDGPRLGQHVTISLRDLVYGFHPAEVNPGSPVITFGKREATAA